jgi:hypothetical protein
MDQTAKESKELHNQALDCEGTDIGKAIRLYKKALEIDDRNVLSCHNLAKLLLTKYEDLECESRVKAEQIEGCGQFSIAVNS